VWLCCLQGICSKEHRRTHIKNDPELADQEVDTTLQAAQQVRGSSLPWPVPLACALDASALPEVMLL
jgi:hypothetical protein